MYKDKERYRVYLRNYYHAHKQLKYDKVNNSIKLLSDEIIKTNNKKLCEMMKNVYDELNEVIPPKYNFEVPQDITDFLNEEHRYPFNNLENKLNQ